MYSREKLTIKDRASRHVLPPKNALQTKRPVFYSPGEFTGKRPETHLHKRKLEILRCQEKRGIELNFTLKTKKPTRGPVVGESKKWSGRRGSNPRLSAPKADALATALRPVCELLKITHPRPIFKPVDDYSPVSGLIFRTYSSFSRSIAIFTPGSGPKRIPFALSSYSAPSSTVPVL